MKHKLKNIYKRLYSKFGPQFWWSGASAFEVMIGAILTQNTNWSNVEKAIAVLKGMKLLNAKKLYKLSPKKLASLIKPAGYYNIKAGRLRNFLKFVHENYSADVKKMSGAPLAVLRGQLLGVNGIGQETADSMLLYGLNKPTFVVDAYTKRILSRHKLIKKEADYKEVQDIFMRNLKQDAKLFNEFHALLVKTAQEFCRKQNPKCRICPLWSTKNA